MSKQSITDMGAYFDKPSALFALRRTSPDDCKTAALVPLETFRELVNREALTRRVQVPETLVSEIHSDLSVLNVDRNEYPMQARLLAERVALRVKNMDRYEDMTRDPKGWHQMVPPQQYERRAGGE